MMGWALTRWRALTWYSTVMDYCSRYLSIKSFARPKYVLTVSILVYCMNSTFTDNWLYVRLLSMHAWLYNIIFPMASLAIMDQAGRVQ